MRLIDTELLRVFWRTVKNYTGELMCVSRQAKQDTDGNPINEYYLPKGNVISKGNKNKPIYFDNNGIAKIVEGFDTNNIIAHQLGSVDIGSVNTPIYLDKGIAKPMTQNVGGNTQFTYMKQGEVVASTANVGSAGSPVFIKNGEFQACTIFPEEMILRIVFPVGRIVELANNADPAKIWGGVWKKIGGRVLLGAGNNEPNTTNEFGGTQNINRPLGERGGEVRHVLNNTEMPAHSHTFSGNTNTTGNHYHGTWGEAYGDPPLGIYAGPGYQGSNGGRDYDNYLYNSTTNGNHYHTVSGNTSAAGNSGPHNNMPPYYVVNIWERIA